MNLTLIVSLVTALCAGAVGYGTAAHFGNVKITELRLEYANERIAIQRANRANTERLASAVTQAQDEAKRRIADLMRDADRARKSSDGLRDTSTSTVRIVTESPATCPAVTAAYRDILAEGSSFIQEVVADVDKCSIERQALIDAWPR